MTGVAGHQAALGWRHIGVPFYSGSIIHSRTRNQNGRGA